MLHVLGYVLTAEASVYTQLSGRDTECGTNGFYNP